MLGCPQNASEACKKTYEQNKPHPPLLQSIATMFVEIQGENKRNQQVKTRED